jgi:hypothetical protein
MDWNVLLFGKTPKFRINILRPSSGCKSEPGRKPAEAGVDLDFSPSAGFLLYLHFDPEDGNNMFL